MPDQQLTYTTTDGAREGTVILTLSGPLTLPNIFALQSDLRTLKPPCLILDLSQVPYIDSAGLGVIMNYYVSAQGNNRKLFMVGTNDRVYALFAMTKVDGILKFADSIEAAQSQC